MSQHLSTLTLHKIRYGEVTGDAMKLARSHLDACTTCTSRLVAQEAERAAFVLQPIPRAIRAIQPRTPAAQRWHDWLPFGVGLLLAATLFVVVPFARTTPTSAVDPLRFRGQGAAIEAWVDTGEGPRPLRDRERLSAGDRVQLRYDPDGAAHVAIAGRDGAGEVQVFSTRAPTGTGLVSAPFALTLDDSPGDQDLFVLTSGSVFDAATVKAAVGPGVPGVRILRLVVEKEPSK